MTGILTGPVGTSETVTMEDIGSGPAVTYRDRKRALARLRQRRYRAGKRRIDYYPDDDREE